MDCETARELLDEPVLDGRVLAHLEGCSACRAEAAFGRRVAGAVAAMPRARAPEGFAARVMAEVRGQTAVHRDLSRLPQMALGTWEMVGIGALCLLLLALVPTALGQWPEFGLGDIHTLLPASPSLFQAPPEWGRDLGDLWRAAGGDGISMTGLSLVWVCGAAAFAAAFSLLMSWRPGGRGGRGVEDAHA